MCWETPEYKDYVAIKSAILMQRNGFVKADFFFTLPEVRMGVLFFHRNRYFGGGFTELKYLSANCQLFKQYQVKPVMVRLFLLLITCYPCFPTQRRKNLFNFQVYKKQFSLSRPNLQMLSDVNFSLHNCNLFSMWNC